MLRIVTDGAVRSSRRVVSRNTTFNRIPINIQFGRKDLHARMWN